MDCRAAVQGQYAPTGRARCRRCGEDIQRPGHRTMKMSSWIYEPSNGWIMLDNVGSCWIMLDILR